MERTLTPQAVDPTSQFILDVRRAADHDASRERLPGAVWKNPDEIDQWIDSLPDDQDITLYCVRGGSVSSQVVDRLQAAGKRARYIEGGLEGWKAAGGKPVAK